MPELILAKGNVDKIKFNGKINSAYKQIQQLR